MEKGKYNEEEMKNAEEARALNVKKTLESKLIQSTIGSNLVKSQPYEYAGRLGLQSAESVYEQTMLSDEAKKIRDGLYTDKLKEGKQIGVAGEPAYPSNYDVSLKLMKEANEVMAVAKLSELEKIAKETGAKLSFEVPAELKDFSTVELIKKEYNPKTGEVDIKKLDEKEKDALGFYQTLSEAYMRACALKASKANYFADLNAQGKQIADKYGKEDLDKAK